MDNEEEKPEGMDIEIFKPGMVELKALASSFAGLSINGLDDEEGFEKVKKARIKLKKTRCEIQETGKAGREKAIAFQKGVIQLERELIAIIEPTEKRLKDQEEWFEREKEKAKRIVSLPERKARLATIECNLSDEANLEMDDVEFEVFFERSKTHYDARQTRLAQEKLDAERKAFEAEKRKAADEKAAAEAEAKRQADIKIAEEKAREDERKRIEQEAKDEADRKAKEQKALERTKRYKEFLESHGYVKGTENEFMCRRDDFTGKVELFKKVGEFNP